jgi:hypothetical protein
MAFLKSPLEKPKRHPLLARIKEGTLDDFGAAIQAAVLNKGSMKVKQKRGN